MLPNGRIFILKKLLALSDILLVNYLFFCVPILHINDYRDGDIVLNTLITEFITVCVKHHMTRRMPKSTDFYKVSLCNNTTVSTCTVPGNKSTQLTRSGTYPFPVSSSRSLARLVGLQEI